MAKTIKGDDPATPSGPAPRPKCGLVMPISNVEPYRPGHWADVKGILVDGISDAGFDTELVSSDPVYGVIHARIVKNL